jgi:hypothetical protein
MATKNGTEVVVTRLPKCDIHPDRDARYDFASTMGQWMYGCETCYRTHGRGLGIGKGQRLVLPPPTKP